MRKIKIHPSFIIVWLLFLLSDKSTYILYLFLAASIHEIAHIAAFISFNAQIKEINILPFGIGVKLQSAALSYKREILAALAGPSANGLIAVLFSLISDKYAAGLQFFIVCNTALALINLLPIYPLDGGRAMYFLICNIENPLTAKRISLLSSLILLLPLFAVSIWILWATGYNFSLLLIVFYLLFYLLCKKY